MMVISQEIETTVLVERCRQGDMDALRLLYSGDDSDFLQLNKTIVRNHFREQVAHMIAHMLVEMLQAPEARVVERYHDGHHLGVGHAAVAVIVAIAEAFAGL